MQEPNHKRKRPRKKAQYQSPSWGERDAPEVAAVTGCTGKRRFPDLIAAHAAAHHMAILRGDSEVYLYLCEHCSGYHLTKAKVSPDGKLNRWAYFFGKD